VAAKQMPRYDEDWGDCCVNRADLQCLAQQRILDAKSLLDGGRWEFAYYAAGYAVECALKSCFLARMIYTGWVFQDKAKIAACLTHKFEELIDLSGLRDDLNANFRANPRFVGNWGIATQWEVAVRYERKTETEARELYSAITDTPDGVLPWIMNYW
jgi:hypothetical protein